MRRAPAALALLLAAACGGESPPAQPGAQAPAAQEPAPKTFGAFGQANLVIISLDTLRADDTSLGGGQPELSPTLAKFAQEAVVFEQARSQAPHTAPSHMSLFTSTLPRVHEVQNVSFTKAEEDDAAGKDKTANGAGKDKAGAESKVNLVPLRPDIPTLAEVLAAAGFATVALTDGGNLNPAHGFSRGFDTYSHELEGAVDKVKAGHEWLGKLAAAPERFFLFWHTYQIHAPYCPPEEYVGRWAPADYAGIMRGRLDSLAGLSFKERFSKMKTLFWKDRESFGPDEARFLHGVYRGGIRFTDDQLGGLFQSLRDTGVLERSIVVLLSDHGEEFLEHGRWQHEQLFEECLRVPLVVRLPGARNAGTHLRTPVALVDIMPTVLDLLGVDGRKLEGLPGRVRRGGVSQAAALLSGQEPKPRPIISELINDRAKGGDFERQLAIHANDMVFLYDRARGKKAADGKVVYDHYLYDLKADPTQQTDLVPAGGDALAAFERLYTGYESLIKVETAGTTGRDGVIATPQMMEELRKLGYVGGEGEEPEDEQR